MFKYLAVELARISPLKSVLNQIYMTWNKIFIGYTDTTKHLKVWAPKTHQVLIASEPIVNKSKQGTELLTENPMPPPPKPLRQLAGKPKP